MIRLLPLTLLVICGCTYVHRRAPDGSGWTYWRLATDTTAERVVVVAPDGTRLELSGYGSHSQLIDVAEASARGAAEGLSRSMLPK